MVASKVGWWRRPWTDYGRHGGGDVFFVCFVWWLESERLSERRDEIGGNNPEK